MSTATITDLAYANLGLIVDKLAAWPGGRLRLCMWGEPDGSRYYCNAVNIDRQIVCAATGPTIGRALEELASAILITAEAIEQAQRDLGVIKGSD